MSIATTVQETLKGLEEPVTRLELAGLSGINDNSLGDALNNMVKAKQIFARAESPSERLLRIGTTKRRPANLYSALSPVPPRTQPALVEGTMSKITKSGEIKVSSTKKIKPSRVKPTETTKTPRRRASSDKVAPATLDALRIAIGHTYITVPALATKMGLSRNTIYNGLRQLGDEVESYRDHRRFVQYRLSNVLPERLREPAPQIDPTPEPEPVVEAQTTALEAPKAIVGQVLAFADAFVNQGEELAMANARIEELEASLRQVRGLVAAI